MDGVRNLQNVGKKNPENSSSSTTENWSDKKKSFSRKFYDAMTTTEEKCQ